jgi:hypothetical protein
MKSPRGILNYDLAGHDTSSLTWRLAGSFGGEDYHDRTRGPLNEGGLYAERQGWHLPFPPTLSPAFLTSTSPFQGMNKAGVAFYTTPFNLSLPYGWDIPLSFAFTNTTSGNGNNHTAAYQVQLYVNGYQFGKYIHHLGPQTAFPVPEGILDYHGQNWVALMLWAMEAGGARIDDLELVATAVVESGYGAVALAPLTPWTERPGAY